MPQRPHDTSTAPTGARATTASAATSATPIATTAASGVARTSTATTMRWLVPGLLPAVGSQVHVGILRGLRAVLPLAAAAAHSVSASAAIAVATTATAAITAATAAARYQPTVRRLVRGEHSELADQVPVAQLQRLRAVLSS